MRLVNVKSGTESWLSFRRMHICASDCSSIMQCNPYKSILNLYEEKIFKFEQEDNHFMKRGRDLEPLALECFEQETGLTLFPVVVKHDEIEWMASSLDGLTINRDVLVEIKCNGKTNHELALKGKIPKHYRAQIQHQLCCTGLDYAFYFSFDGSKGKILEVKRDQDFIDEMIEKEFEFWNCLKNLTPPTVVGKSRRKEYATTATPISGSN